MLIPAVVPLMSTVPRFVIVALSAVAAPVKLVVPLFVTGLATERVVAATLNVVPRSVEIGPLKDPVNFSAPPPPTALTVVIPVYVFAPPRVKIPGPCFFKAPPRPERTPE